MTTHSSNGTSRNGATAITRLVIHWVAERNEQGEPMRWFGSWLRADGQEGGWFYTGRGNETTAHRVPAGMTGVRVRRWLSEGLDPEYVDHALDGSGVLDTSALDFDAPRATGPAPVSGA
jgi:hypothetical protein